MESVDDFYLVLPSNSSMSFFPDNTTTNFRTHLPREIKLSGEWAVGLAEIHIPCSINHISEDEAVYRCSYKYANDPTVFDRDCIFPHGRYESIAQLAGEINKANKINDHQTLVESSKRKGYWELQRLCAHDDHHVTKFSDKVCKIFGFESKDGVSFRISKDRPVVEAERPVVLARGIPDQLFVYTDICESYAVGDAQASLLRIVSPDGSKYIFGSNIVRQFGPIHYIPVIKHQFQTVTIDIRDQFGKLIPFEYGTLTVTLHFTRKRY